MRSFFIHPLQAKIWTRVLLTSTMINPTYQHKLLRQIDAIKVEALNLNPMEKH